MLLQEDNTKWSGFLCGRDSNTIFALGLKSSVNDRKVCTNGLIITCISHGIGMIPQINTKSICICVNSIYSRLLSILIIGFNNVICCSKNIHGAQDKAGYFVGLVFLEIIKKYNLARLHAVRKLRHQRNLLSVAVKTITRVHVGIILDRIGVICVRLV